ncbi:MAG: phosphopantothenate/pantothenate synthetase [Methanomicrobiales archaeon]|nr:phosphopantothenate/pantothenate synthetase [Methanomicrobiales archaeon]
MISPDHPRYRSLEVRERLAWFAREGVVSPEGLAAHGRGEAFDYLLGEKTTESALLAERTAAAMLLSARHPVISVNGNTAALAAREIRYLQKATRAAVEVNLFHRTPERVAKVTRLLEGHGVEVLEGEVERLIPVSHDRGWSHHDGAAAADVILVPLEDGDRAEALVSMGKSVIAIDLNPLSRTARAATLTIVDEVTRAIPAITRAAGELSPGECERLISRLDNSNFLQAALDEIAGRLSHALD